MGQVRVAFGAHTTGVGEELEALQLALLRAVGPTSVVDPAGDDGSGVGDPLTLKGAPTGRLDRSAHIRAECQPTWMHLPAGVSQREATTGIEPV